MLECPRCHESNPDRLESFDDRYLCPACNFAWNPSDYPRLPVRVERTRRDLE